jgi:hypothetical protein
MDRFSLQTVSLLLAVLFSTNPVQAQDPGNDDSQSRERLKQTRGEAMKLFKGFVDLDGDGIPNGHDADFVKQKDRSGRQLQNGKGEKRLRLKSKNALGNCLKTALKSRKTKHGSRN